MAKRGFDKDDLCLECGLHNHLHRRQLMHGSSTTWIAYHCPDLSLPDPNKDDDPWVELPGPDPGVAALFDPYD